MSDTCAQLHQALRALERYRFPFDPKRIPSNGLYVLFEKGETGHGGDRIVRVGTHTGEAQLRSRLKQHFITPSKDRSIFRKNIGRALLNRDHDSFMREWEFDLTTRKAKDELGPWLISKSRPMWNGRCRPISRNDSSSWSLPKPRNQPGSI
jgi:hypothetical protein